VRRKKGKHPKGMPLRNSLTIMLRAYPKTSSRVILSPAGAKNPDERDPSGFALRMTQTGFGMTSRWK
jgi:hypothetical protein